jgi:toxin ParE1/3/4
MRKDRFNVELTEGAEGDLEAIFDYLTEHQSNEQAREFLSAVEAKIETLERFPLRGPVPKELESLGIREFLQVLMTPYRLIYRVIVQRVFILVIADGRRDTQALLERRLFGR